MLSAVRHGAVAQGFSLAPRSARHGKRAAAATGSVRTAFRHSSTTTKRSAAELERLGSRRGAARRGAR